MQILNYKFLFFLERDFHIALLKPLIIYIYNNKIGDLAIYSPFINDTNSIIDKNFDFNIKVLNDPRSWNPDITFMADFSYQYIEGLGKIVNIGHGTICKGWFYSYNKISQRENCADLICVPGTVHKDRLLKQVYKKIEVTGMPKLDNCFNNTLNKKNILKKMDLNIEQKTILLAPTFNDEFSIIPFLQQSNFSSIFPDYLNLIIKFHGILDSKIKANFENLKNNRKNVYIADSFDTDDLYVAADLLISDVSSVVYEFYALNKPVLLFDSPKQQSYINYDKNDLEWQYRDIGYRFNDINLLPALIFKAFTTDKKEHNSEIANSFISVRDGSSTKKVVDLAISLLNNEENKFVDILVSDHNSKFAEKFKNQFSVSSVHGNLYEQFLNHSKASLSNYLIFMDSQYDFSPQIANLLLNQIINNPDVGMVLPLIDDNNVHLQQMKLRIKLQHNLTFEQTGIQLAYSFTGQNTDIDFALPYCFIIDMDLLRTCPFSDFHNNQLCMHELITHSLKNKKRILLSYDTVIKKIETQINTSTNKYFSSSRDFSSNNGSDVEESSLNEITEENLKLAIYDNPFNETAILNLIEYYFKHKNWDQVDVYSDMIQNNYYAIYYNIKSLEQQGFIQKSFEKIQQIEIYSLEDSRLQNKFNVLKAKLMMKLQFFSGVLEILNNVLSNDEFNIEALLTRGVFYITNNSIQLAINDFDRVLNLDKNNNKALQGKGLALHFIKDYDSSSLCFLKILDNDSEDLEAIEGLLKNAWHTKKFTEIEKALENYLDFHPANLEILFTLSGIYYEQNKYQRTIELLEKILIFQDDYPGANELLQKCKNMLY